MRKIAIALGAGAAFAASPALAQDEANWNGFHAGAIAGYENFTIEEEVSDTSGDEDGAVYGLLVGYDVDTGSAVFGIDAEVAGAGTGVTETDVFVAGDEVSLDAGRDLYIGVRGGIKAGSNLLIYAKGGYTNAKLILKYDDGVDAFKESDTIDGFRIGGGIEALVSENFTVRGEYRYSDYGEYKYDGFATGLNASRSQFIVGLTSKF